MTKSEILEDLKANQDARGIAHWKKHEAKSGGLKSFGIGLVKLRKYSRTVGRDPKLAGQLWQANLYEMKIIALLIDDPKSMTIEQAETQVEQLQGGYLAHVFSSCDATLAKAPFVVELADKWIKSKDACANVAAMACSTKFPRAKRRAHRKKNISSRTLRTSKKLIRSNPPLWSWQWPEPSWASERGAKSSMPPLSRSL